jgi:membrane associated rhomboid family serine protease
MNINTMGNFNNNGPGGQNMSISDKMKAFWAMVPICVRMITTITIVVYLLSWFLPYVEYLVNYPFYVVFYIQIWRLVTSVFATLSIINILFAFISWVPDAIRLENTSGTVRYFLNFLTNSTLINILYVIMMLLFSIFFGTAALKVPSSGLWPIIMAEITMLCLANPDNPVQLFFIPCQFSAIYYPWALFGLFTIFNGNISFDLLAGIGYGYLFFYFLRSKIQFSNEFIIKCENFALFKFMSKFTGFITLQQTFNNSGFSAFNMQQTQQQNNNTSNFRVEQPVQAPVSTPFKGKGHVVGKIFLK